MKKLIALIVLMSGLAVTAQAETKTLIVKYNTSKSLEVKEGQIATIVFWGITKLYFNTTGNKSPLLSIEHGGESISFSRDSFSVSQGNTVIAQMPSFIPVVPGPANITLNGFNAQSSMITVKIENDSGAGDSNSVTVIPDSTEDDTLVLEGSDDMVNWTEETLGEKPKANRKKFYRLRAKKE